MRGFRLVAKLPQVSSVGQLIMTSKPMISKFRASQPIASKKGELQCIDAAKLAIRTCWGASLCLSGLVLSYMPAVKAEAINVNNTVAAPIPQTDSQTIESIAREIDFNPYDGTAPNSINDVVPPSPKPYLTANPNLENTNLLPSQTFTAVIDLSDVKPTDQSFQALTAMQQRYQCGDLVQSDNSTANNAAINSSINQPSINRYEFAVGLNRCLETIQNPSRRRESVSESDIKTLTQLQQKFGSELAAVRRRTIDTEPRVTQIANHTFSPTAKLRGIVVFLAGGTLGNQVNRTSNNSEAFLGYYTLLGLNTTFSGNDMLRIRLAATNLPLLSSVTGTTMTNTVLDPLPLSSLQPDRINYQFAAGPQTTIWLGLTGMQPFEYLPVLNPLIASVNGPISRFAWYNPAVYRAGFAGTGIIAAHRFSPQWQIHAGYVVSSNQASLGNSGPNGLFNSSNNLLAQLTFTPQPEVSLGLAYARKYFASGTVNLYGNVGSTNALTPFGQNATIADNLGFQFHWRINPKVAVGGWFGYTSAQQASARVSNSASMITTSLNVAFPDLFREGDLAGLVVGIPPKVTSNSFLVNGVPRLDKDTSMHWEVFYTFPINRNFSITPNIYLITNPEHNNNNQSIWVAMLRTTFVF